MTKLYDMLFFIGRMEPIHYGHLKVIQEGLDKLKPDGKLIILVGSASSAPTLRNPLSYGERVQLIMKAIPDERIILKPINDYIYNQDAWLISAQQKIFEEQEDHYENVGLIGMYKDGSSYYLNLFPEYDNLAVTPYDFGANVLSSTDIRNMIFEHYTNQEIDIVGELQKVMPNSIIDMTLEFFQNKPNLLKDYVYIKEYKKLWESSPFPPSFNTVDAVVVQSGYILLVERGGSPGIGQFALPGGFINADETTRNAVIRELYEETGLKVPKPVLAGSIVKSHTYDDPYRSSRGRTFTHAFHFALRGEPKLPRVKGADDAAKAFWFPLADLRCEDMFEDHYQIICHMLGLNGF